MITGNLLEDVINLFEKYDVKITLNVTDVEKTVKEKIVEVPTNMESYSFGKTSTVKEVENKYKIVLMNLSVFDNNLFTFKNKISTETLKDFKIPERFDTEPLSSLVKNFETEFRELFKYYGDACIIACEKSCGIYKGYTVYREWRYKLNYFELTKNSFA